MKKKIKNTKGAYAFFGVDGAGKTSTIHGVKKALEKKGYPCKIYLMGRAGNHKIPLIKTFMRLKARRLKIKKGINPKEHALLVDIYRKRGLGFMLIYFMDLWLRFFEIKRLAKKEIILTDRFFYDGLALTKRKYLSFFRKFTPRVKSFFLYADPKVILKRKKEATAQNMRDYKRRVEKDFVPYFDISMIDNGNLSLPQVINKIVKEIEHEQQR